MLERKEDYILTEFENENGSPSDMGLDDENGNMKDVSLKKGSNT